MANVQVDVATPDERAVIENLMQLYVHDFSEFWADRPEGEFEADGRFAPYPLDPYWRDPSHVPLLLRVNGRLAGFALLDRESHAGRALDRNMAEFFIARKYRRGGVGRAAAQAIFSRYPGQWEAAVARRNIAALAFWRQAVAQHPGVSDIDEIDMANAHWNGPVLRFRIA